MRRYAPYHAGPKYARLVPVGNALALESSYDRDLIWDFKSRIPETERRWDPDGKRWFIAPQHGVLVAQLCANYLGVTPTVPQLSVVNKAETRLIKLEYLGRTKDRSGEPSAMGLVNGTWSLLIPEAVLREWFEAVPQAPGEKPTLYAVLAIKPAATAEEIKTAHRRMVKQWHPDVNRNDPDAAEQFKVIQHAYQVLSDQIQRRKYDAGLAFVASLKQQKRNAPLVTDTTGYRAPLRCGWILAEGVEMLGRFVVSKLLQWEDVTDAQGHVMVTSWAAGADKPTVTWQ